MSGMVVKRAVIMLCLVMGGPEEAGGWHRRHGRGHYRRGGDNSGILHYDPARYEYEDRLIMGLLDDHTDLTLEEPPMAQPLNYRLPLLPTKPPKFLGPSPLNITAVQGSTVVLPCRVTDLGSASLSWVRLPLGGGGHLTVLSSSSIMFSSSPRLSLLHHPESPDWTLQIGPLIKEDEGDYECQANTEPKTSRMIHLTVVGVGEHNPGPGPALALQGEEQTVNVRTQKTSILAPEVLHPEPGDTVTLECVVTEHAIAPLYFTWYISGSPLDFSHHRGGLLLQEDMRSRSSASRLTITRLQAQDSGDYTCSPAAADNATVKMVVQLKKAVSSFFSGGGSVSRSSLTITFTIIIFFFFL